MRIQFKCSCGAEAMWCNDDDCQVDRDHVERYASEWLADHAKCREAARLLKMSDDGRVEPVFPKPEPAKECEHYPMTDLHPVEKALMTRPCPKCGKPIPTKGL